MSYLPEFLIIVEELDHLMQEFSHTKKDIGYGYRRTFENKQRFDLIDYKNRGEKILRVGRGARLVRQHPVLHDRFDEVAKVIAKVIIHDKATLTHKNFIGIAQLLNDAPSGIGAFD